MRSLRQSLASSTAARWQIAGIALELLLELLVKSERVGHRAGEAREDLTALEDADLVGMRLDDALTDGDLTVAAERDAAVFANGENGGAVRMVGYRLSRLSVTPRMRLVVHLLQRSTLVWV